LFSPVRFTEDILSRRSVFPRLVREKPPARQHKLLVSPGMAKLHTWSKHALLESTHNLLIGKSLPFERERRIIHRDGEASIAWNIGLRVIRHALEILSMELRC
jgi:hypothetical protein